MTHYPTVMTPGDADRPQPGVTAPPTGQHGDDLSVSATKQSKQTAPGVTAPPTRQHGGDDLSKQANSGDDAQGADDADGESGGVETPRCPAPPFGTTDSPSVSAGVLDDGSIGHGGCLAHALEYLGTGITKEMLNKAAEDLIKWKLKGKKGANFKKCYEESDRWPAEAVPLAFKELGRPFVWKKLKGNELSDTNLKRLLNSKGGRFVVDGYMAKDFLWKGRKGEDDERVKSHDDPIPENRHVIAIKDGRVYCNSIDLNQMPTVNSVLHIGPKMKHDGYMCIITKVYKYERKRYGPKK